MVQNQKSGKPIHEWELADMEIVKEWHPYSMLVEEFMTTDVFTVHEDDIPELVSDILVWRKIKYIPIEDNKGKLKGLITYREILDYLNKVGTLKKKNTVTVKKLMDKNPICVEPEATVSDALLTMKKNKVDCLPVVKNDKLVGVITEGNFINITQSLMSKVKKDRS